MHYGIKLHKIFNLENKKYCTCLLTFSTLKAKGIYIYIITLFNLQKLETFWMLQYFPGMTKAGQAHWKPHMVPNIEFQMSREM